MPCWTDDSVLSEFIADTMDDYHDQDVTIAMHARNLARTLEANGLVATDLPAELARIQARAAAALGENLLFVSMTVWPLAERTHRAGNFSVVIFQTKGDAIYAWGATAADAITAAEALLDAQDPARIEAEGWATIGATPAAA